MHVNQHFNRRNLLLKLMPLTPTPNYLPAMLSRQCCGDRTQARKRGEEGERSERERPQI